MSRRSGLTVCRSNARPLSTITMSFELYGPRVSDNKIMRFPLRFDPSTPVGDVLPEVLRWIEAKFHRWVIADDDLGMHGDISHYTDTSRSCQSMRFVFQRLYPRLDGVETPLEFCPWHFVLYPRLRPHEMYRDFERSASSLSHGRPAAIVLLDGMTRIGTVFSATAIGGTFRRWSDSETAEFNALLGDRLVCVFANNQYYVALRESLEHLKTCHPSLSGLAFERLFQKDALSEEIRWVVDRILSGAFTSIIILFSLSEVQAEILSEYTKKTGIKYSCK